MNRHTFFNTLALLPIVFLVILVLSFPGSVLAIEVELIENPKPTHFEEEKLYKELIIVKEIPADFDEDYFLAQPNSIEVDNDGNIYVYDNKLYKIFKFSKDFTFIKNFGRTGVGPGDISDMPFTSKFLYFNGDGNLYLSCAPTKKIIVYQPDGTVIKEIPIPRYYPRLIPVIDKEANIYLPSMDGAVVVYNKERKKIHTFLENKEYCTFLLMTPTGVDFSKQRRMDWTQTGYDLLPGNRFIIYIYNSSSVYFFKDWKLEKKIRIWPEGAIKVQMKNKKRSQEYGKKSINTHWGLTLFNDFFIDKDRDFFYLGSLIDKKDRRMLYQFNMAGELVHILYIDKQKLVGQFAFKKNNLFYGITFDGDIKIMKESNSQ